MNREELIHGYFEKTLTEGDRLIFNELRESDAGFAEEVAFQEAIKKQLHVQKRTDLKMDLRGFETEKKKVIPLRWKWFSVAAALIMGVCTWIFMQKGESKKDLYAAYYQPFPNVTAPNVRGNNDVSEKSAALDLYDNEDYATALPLFEKLYEKDSSDYSYFYQGICQLELENPVKAISLFENATYNESTPWQNVTDWYLALAYLKTGKKNKAQAKLKKVVEADNFMAKQAKEILVNEI